MIDRFLPHGSRRRNALRDNVLRLKYSRSFSYNRKNYNRSREQYYKVQNHGIAVNTKIKFSIIVPCFNTPEKYLTPLIDSVFAQNYPNWELVLIDGSNDKALSDAILSISTHDERIIYKKVANKGIAQNTNEGIRVATGKYICFLDHDDTLDPYALYENALAIEETNAELLYSDEDKISEDGDLYFEPHFKPDFSIDMLRSVNYITHFVCVEKSLAEKVGLIRSNFEGAQDYDFLLRVVDATDKIYHIPKILYHWRQAENSTAANFSNKQNIFAAGERALNDHYVRNKIKATAQGITTRPGWYRTVYELSQRPKRAVILALPESTPKKIVDFISAKYKKLKEIRDGEIALVVVCSPDKKVYEKYDFVLLVRDLIAPTHSDHSVNNIFGALENGADIVTVRQITRGRILDCGYVYDDNHSLVPLFRGVDPRMPGFFGSHEWTRSVDAVASTFVAASVGLLQSVPDKQRLILSKDDQSVVCFGEYEYQLFGDLRLTNTGSANNFNPNLEYEVYPRIKQYDIAQENLEISE